MCQHFDTPSYGIDILQDNVEECRERLLTVITEHYGQITGDLLASTRYVLSRNILWGDALTLCTPLPPKGGTEGGQPIIFSEWGFIGERVKRRDFTLDMLLRPRTMSGPSLFDELGDEVFLPEPCHEYPPTHYLRLHAAQQ